MAADKYMTQQEVAKLLKVNVRTVTRWFNEGKVAGVRLPDRGIRIETESLRKLGVKV